MSFRCVHSVARVCSYSNAPVPDGSSSSKFSFFSSKSVVKTTPSAIDLALNSVVKKTPSVQLKQKKKKKSPSAIDLALNSVVKKTPSVQQKQKKKKKTPSAIDLALNSVVKVFTVFSEPDLNQPWEGGLESECTGSGFVISGKKILTNAHVVLDHISVKVRKHGTSTRYKATVRAIGHECDLAILEIDSDEFWEGTNSLEFGDIPSLQDKVVVVGYTEGTSISVTEGIVSRVELLEYSHSDTELLAIQIDAAIYSGNSGGPVIMENKVVGVAFETLCDDQNIGYIIPTPVIKQFINGVEESGQYVSLCSMNLSYQTMENPELRDLYKMRTGMTGILINQINPISDASKYLKKEDVILAIDGVPIDNDSTVPFRNKERIKLTHLISTKKQCDTALFKVFREGKEYEFNISLKPVQPLVPGIQFEKLSSYYIFGGLVFVPLSEEYIYSSESSDVFTWALGKMSTKVGEQFVIVSEVLDDDINTGYSKFIDKQVKKVNGVQVDNLQHLYELIEECRTGIVKLEFEKGMILGLNHKSAKKATRRIMKSHNIPSAMSEDLIQPRQKAPRESQKKQTLSQ